MTISPISTDDLRRMDGQEGLVLQGCGGDLSEWVNGINDTLTKSGILLDETKFENAFSFQHSGVTCLLFPFSEDIKLHIGKFAMWRLQTHGQLGGTWLSDFIPNHLGGYLDEKTPERIKPDCPLIGQDGNIFNLLGIASRTLRENGLREQAKEMCDRVYASGSYEAALCILGEYVHITSAEEQEKPSVKEMLRAVETQAEKPRHKAKEHPER